MLSGLKIFVYPDIYNSNSSFAGIFLPYRNPYNPKLGNYFSEHMFKINLLRSPFLTPNPEEAHFFFLPFSINSLRNDRRVFSEASISQFVADYSKNISERFGFWNRSRGADHFYVCCHSVGRDVASKFLDLHRYAIQVVCSSSYFQKFYVSHKDVAMPQVWPRLPKTNLVPKSERTILAFFAGREQNSIIRQQLIDMWGNDTSMIISGKYHNSQEGFTKSKYCLHVKGYEVNTARVSDAIHFGCVPVIISNHYDLPFANVLDWSKFSIVISHSDIPHLKAILLSISEKMYASFLANLHKELVLIGLNLTTMNLGLLASNCQALERLALYGSDTIGDVEIGGIAAKYISLKKLCIKGCPVSDQGIESLISGCPKLVKIKVKKCRGVISEGADRLKANRVSLAINLDCMPSALTNLIIGETLETTGSSIQGGNVLNLPSSNRASSSLAKANFSLFARRNFVACAFMRLSNGSIFFCYKHCL
ncbi:hypothetical protein KI387_001025 [Taxus chinensis]|uniref:Exostosin GT47 domain-containing protein n=1 Tax=Taxus chinensis TaxID=29808 RepID=A0AA38GTD7_TAXCH|nr:hypothetical protein KI387_001025 [Taxus chinensis]